MRYSLKTETPIDHQQVWREYLTRNIVFWGLLVGFIPVMVLIGEVTQRLGLHNPLGFVGIGWMAALIGVGSWRMRWKCPRCGKRFYYKWWYENSFALKCVHCGFRPTKG